MPPKKVHANSLLGQRGINLIEGVVLRLGFLWYPTGQVEAGIDGVIEIRDDVSGVVTNSIIQVQSRATGRPFTAETESTFEYLCDERELSYWLAGNAPVILVVSRPDKDEVYWVSLKTYFSDSIRIRERRITFDKVKDRFDDAAKPELIALALPRDAGIYLAPEPKSERLYTNLLPVVGYADRLFVATTPYRERRQLWAAANERQLSIGDEWVLKDQRLYSLHDLREQPWPTLCDRGTIEDFATSEWAFTSDPARRRDFVDLLNRCLTVRARRLDLTFHRALKFYYFRATADLSPRVISYHSFAKKATRTVFQGYPSKTTPGQIAYYRHSAFEGKFRSYDDAWFLEITPTYHFTRDGYTLDPYYEDHLKHIKQLERNAAVAGQVLMWAGCLQEPADLFSTPYPFLQFGELATLEIDVGIQDRAWRGHEEPEEAATLASPINEGLWAEHEA